MAYLPPIDWKDYDEETGIGDPSTPLSAANVKTTEAALAAYAEAVAAGGIEVASVEIEAWIQHTGTTLGLGTTPVVLNGAEKGVRPQVAYFNAPWATIGAIGFYVVQLERSPAGAATWTPVGFRTVGAAAANQRLVCDFRFPVMRQAEGTYDYRLQFQTGNAAHQVTIVCDDGTLGQGGPATLEIVEL